jgi:hypothetical protein
MKGLAAVLLILISHAIHGQESLRLNELMATCNATSPKADAKLHDFIQLLKTKRPRSDKAFLKKVFHKTERNFLKKYSSYSGFDRIFEDGRFDCLTATSLFSVILQDLGFDFDIVETNYHIFLMVRTSHGDVLLETTDRLNGFVQGKNLIDKKKDSYSHYNSFINNRLIFFRTDPFRKVNPTQLPGLLYFNQAIMAYHSGNITRAGELLAKSTIFYHSSRVADLAAILRQAAIRSRLSEYEKLTLLKSFDTISGQMVASR